MDVSLTDRAYRALYRLGYQLMRTYWRIRKPDSHGAAIALWHEHKLLLVENSYRPGFSLPGGGVGRRETARDAACRELREEVGISCDPRELVPALELDWIVDQKRDHLTIFELHRGELPSISIDRREVIWAGWFTHDEALEQKIAGQLRRYLEHRRN